jgi:ABC-2 type transport system ATP-binding protein
MPPAIEAQGICKSFRSGFMKPRKPVLREVDLEVSAGAIFGILGPNGAGKTTLISILTTLLLPDGGWARVLGLDVVKEAHAIRQRVNLAASSAHFLWYLSAEECLRFAGRLYGLGGRDLEGKIDELLELFDLTAHRREKFENLSTGLKQRLALAKTLINSPELLFLDEPSTGLDPVMAQHIREEILRLNRETGVTILITTHNLREAELLCSEVAFLKEGALLARGRIADLQARLGLGDRLSLIFEDRPASLDYGSLPGVLAHQVMDSQVHLRVDRVELRLAGIIEAVSRTSHEVREVRLKELDLEEIYREITH